MKQKRYWLRGGIIASVLTLTCIIAFNILNIFCTSYGFFCDGYVASLAMRASSVFTSIDFFYYLMKSDIEGGGFFDPDFYRVITIWPSVFIIGMLEGLLYERIRNLQIKQ